MKHGRPRPLTLFDAMALVVAVAAGLAIVRSFGNFMTVRREVAAVYRTGKHSTLTVSVSTSDLTDRATAALYRPRIQGQFIYWAGQLAFWPGPCVTALSLATLGLGLRARNCPRRRLARRPGMAAGVAVLLAVLVSAVRCPHLLLTGPSRSPNWPVWWLEVWFTLPRLGGFAVAASWLTLALSGRWRPTGLWPDRLGVALGACWIGMATLDLAATWVHALPI